MERLLNAQEIALVCEEGKKAIYQVSNAIFMFGAKTITSILIVSEKGLIFIKGNDDTGFNHINERHGYYTHRTDWIKNQNPAKDSLQLDNPSKFSGRSIPILDYVKIVDAVLCDENKVISKDPEKFDKYTGVSDVFENRELRFHLLLMRE